MASQNLRAQARRSARPARSFSISLSNPQNSRLRLYGDDAQAVIIGPPRVLAPEEGPEAQLKFHDEGLPVRQRNSFEPGSGEHFEPFAQALLGMLEPGPALKVP